MVNRVVLPSAGIECDPFPAPLSAAMECHPFPASLARCRPDGNDRYHLSDVNRNDKIFPATTYHYMPFSHIEAINDTWAMDKRMLSVQLNCGLRAAIFVGVNQLHDSV